MLAMPLICVAPCSAVVTAAGWEYDAQGGMLKPFVQPAEAKKMPTLDHLQDLVGYAVHMG